MSADTSGEVTIYAGDVVTMDPDQPTAEAVVVAGEQITFVGSRADAVNVSGPAATVVDLGEQAILPGLIDSHGHIGLVALYADYMNVRQPPLGPASSIEDMVELLRQRAEQDPTSEWVLGNGYDSSQLTDGRHPTRDDLDRVSMDRPVAAVHFSQHMGVLNSAGLAAWGISAETPDPESGKIHRRAGSMEPTGLLEEQAWIVPLTRNFSVPSPQKAIANLVAAQDLYAAAGYTTVQDGATVPQFLELFTQAASAGLLKLDIVGYPLAANADESLAAHVASVDYTDRFRVGGVKIILDGGLPGQTAWLCTHYLNPPAGTGADYAGYSQVSDEELVELLTKHNQLGRQLLIHAMGDAASEQLVRAIEEVRGGQSGDDRDFVMIHATMVSDGQLDRMKHAGVMPSFFSVHNHLWGDFHRDSLLGDDRAQRINPAGSATRKEIPFTIHNDSPVVPPLSMLLIYSTVARKTRSGQVLGESERVSTYQALRAMTIDAAYQYREESTKGSLTVGKQADLVVLSANPLAVSEDDLPQIEVVRTISRGTQIYPA